MGLIEFIKDIKRANNEKKFKAHYTNGSFTEAIQVLKGSNNESAMNCFRRMMEDGYEDADVTKLKKFITAIAKNHSSWWIKESGDLFYSCGSHTAFFVGELLKVTQKYGYLLDSSYVYNRVNITEFRELNDILNHDKYLHHIGDARYTTKSNIGDITLYFQCKYGTAGKSLEFKETFKPHEYELTTYDLYEIYKITIATGVFGSFMSEEIVRKILLNGEHVIYSKMLIDSYQEEHKILYLENAMKWGDDGLIKMLDKVESLNTNNSDEYNFIMDILKCKSSKILVKILDMSDLSVSQKQELMLLKTREGCKTGVTPNLVPRSYR